MPLIACCVPLRYRAQIESCGRRALVQVVHLATKDELWDCMRQRHPAVAIVLFDQCSSTDADELRRTEQSTPFAGELFLIHESVTAADMRLLLAFVRVPLRIRHVYAAYHDVEQQLWCRPPKGLPSGTVTVLRRLAELLGDSVAEEVATCLVSCERHTTLRRTARLLGLSEARMRERLAAAGLPEFRKIAAAVRIAHAMHRMETGATAPDAAASVGYASSESLDNAVAKHLGVTRQSIIDRRDYGSATRRIESWLCEPRATGS